MGDRRRRLKAGAAYSGIKFSIQDAQIIDIDPDVNFVTGLPDNSTAYADIYTQEPMEFSAYLQDKMEFNEMVINAGVRLDYYDLNTTYPSNWRNPGNTPRLATRRRMSDS